MKRIVRTLGIFFSLCLIMGLAPSQVWAAGSGNVDPPRINDSGASSGGGGTIWPTDSTDAEGPIDDHFPCERDSLFLSFSATTTDILIGQGEMVYFSAEIEVGHEPGDGRMPVYDETGALICYLYDDAGASGESDADAIAGDNVYSGQALLSASEKRLATFTAVSDGAQSPGLIMNFYDIIDTSSPEYQAMLDMIGQLSAFGTYPDADGAVDEDLIDADIERVLDILDTGLEDGTVLNVERAESSDSIYVDFASGVMYVWYPEIEGVLGGAPRTSQAPYIAETTANRSGSKTADSPPSAVDDPDSSDLTDPPVPTPVASETNSPMASSSTESTQPVVLTIAADDDVKEIGEALESAPTHLLNAGLNFQHETISKSQATVKRLKTAFKDKAVILWSGHGDFKDDGLGGILIIGEPITAAKTREYSADIAARRIGFARESDVYCISARFFNTYYDEGDLDGSIIYLGSCKVGADSALAKSLIRKGASAVMAYNKDLSAPYSGRMMNVICQQLAQKHSSGARYKNVGEAVAVARKLPAWDSPLAPAGEGPYGEVLQLFGDAEATLDHKRTASASAAPPLKAVSQAA
jgi:hypothetical protein